MAQCLSAIRRNECVAGMAQGFNVVKVSVADVRVGHEVKSGDFAKFLDRTGITAGSTPEASIAGCIPFEQIRTEFSMKFGDKIDVLETMQTAVAA